MFRDRAELCVDGVEGVDIATTLDNLAGLLLEKGLVTEEESLVVERLGLMCPLTKDVFDSAIALNKLGDAFLAFSVI